LFAASGEATPSTMPVPNFSGVLETFFSSELACPYRVVRFQS
jgi:hypothetical protein